MIERVMRAVKLDVDFYRETHDDDALTGEAFILVAMIGAVSGALGGSISDDGSFVGGLIGGAIGAPIGLVIGGGILLLLGRLFKGSAQYLGLVRNLAYASAPNILSWIPFVGFLASIWSFVCLVVAVRESHKLSTGAAVVVVLIPTAIVFFLIFVLALLGLALLAGLAS